MSRTDTVELQLPPASGVSVARPGPGSGGGGPGDAGTGRADVLRVAQAVHDGLPWICREGFRDVLERTPASVWGAPERQGWRLIKQNALRSVWRGVLEGRAFYMKYYRTRWLDALRALWRAPGCRSEWDSGMYALRFGIAAVRPVGCTTRVGCDGGRCALLVTEALEPAHTLSEFWRMIAADGVARRRREDTAQLCDLLGELIARAHQAGFEHIDMHANNILVQPVAPRRYRAALVDLHSARLGSPLSDAAVVRNLAQLNQWFGRHSSVGDRLRFLRAYLRWRGEYEAEFPHGRALGLDFEQLVRALSDAARRHAERLWAQRDRRLGRGGRYYARTRLGGGWSARVQVRCKHAVSESPASRLVLEREWWRRQLRSPLAWFAEDAPACKASHSAAVTRAVLSTGDGAALPVIIKRPLGRSVWRRVRLLVAPSRSARGWKMGHALLHRDLPTARPLALLERRLGPLVLDSLLLTEAIPGAQDLETHLRSAPQRLSPADWRRHKRRLAAALAGQVRRLHERGFIHRDCKAGNLLVLPGPGPRLAWIDMDGLRRRPAAALDQHRALARLHVSLLGVAGLTRSDRLRFLRAYCAGFGRGPREWRAVWRAVARLSAEKLAAAPARREWKLRRYGRT